MDLKDVFDKISDDYNKMKSINFGINEKDNTINIYCVRAYGNTQNATGKQVDYIKSFDNVEWRSTSNLMKANKWCASAIISIAKQFEKINFKVII